MNSDDLITLLKNKKEGESITVAKGMFCSEILGDLILKNVRFVDCMFNDADLFNKDDHIAAYIDGCSFVDCSLSSASFRHTTIKHCYFYNSNLSRARFGSADMDTVNLERCSLRNVNFDAARLQSVRFENCSLRNAYFEDSNMMREVTTNHPQLPQGELEGWKLLCGGTGEHDCYPVIARLRIPRDAQRVQPVVGYKCRASFVITEELFYPEGIKGSPSVHASYDRTTVYRVGEWTVSDRYDDNPFVQCSHGIHFFLTRKEAEDYVL